MTTLAAANTETVSTASIIGVYWSGEWTVKRGANTVLNLTGSGYWKDIHLDQDASANIVCELVSSNGSIYLTGSKKSSIS